MRFKFGPSSETKRQNAIKARNKRVHELNQWHKWFAWYPVRIGEYDVRWLESVERRLKLQRWLNRDIDYWETLHLKHWEYRTIENEVRLWTD